MNSGRADKNPWVKWWWSDWFSDTGVRSVSLAARGLWADMLGIMSRSPRFGYLEKIEEINGELVTKQIDSKTIAKISGESEKTVDELIRELGRHGVYSKTESGIIFCRRMAREHDIAKKREAAGRIGGQSRWQNSSKRIDPSASASASDSLFLSSEEEEKEEKREDPLTDIPKEIIEESTKELQRIFKEGGHSDLLKEKKFLDFMISLCLEYHKKGVDDIEETIKEKFAHWMKIPLKPSSNIYTQFRNWFRLQKKYEEEAAKNRRVGKHRPEK